MKNIYIIVTYAIGHETKIALNDILGAYLDQTDAENVATYLTKQTGVYHTAISRPLIELVEIVNKTEN